MTTDWTQSKDTSRTTKIKSTLSGQGASSDSPYIEIVADGTIHYAYPDSVCMVVLEYYAFEAGQNIRQHAVKNYRLLARRSFRDFIYTQVGYDPAKTIPEIWKQFHDRVSLVYDKVPRGYFGIFKEIAEIIVSLIKAGAPIGSDFVPDISVGQAWSKHWLANDFDAHFGQRKKYEHSYPSYFPQAPSNPQPAFRYPEDALGEFRRWFGNDYLVTRFPGYLKNKEREGKLPPSFAELALGAIEERKAIEPPA